MAYTAYDLISILTSEGVSASRNSLNHALRIGLVDEPTRSGNGQRLFTGTHLRQYRNYCTRVRSKGRPPKALAAAG